MARICLVFGDIEGKPDVLNVECTKRGRKGRYHVHKLSQGPAMAFVARLDPAGFDFSRCSLRSVEGGLEEVREVFSGRCRTAPACSSSPRSMLRPYFKHICWHNFRFIPE